MARALTQISKILNQNIYSASAASSVPVVTKRNCK